MLTESLKPYEYLWSPDNLPGSPGWQAINNGHAYVREMPETLEYLATDSRWPAFFPAPMCLVTTTDGVQTALEKVVGASIVDRFPYVMALSFCQQPLSERHHARQSFMDILEQGGTAAVQFLPPGPLLDQAMRTILSTPDEQTHQRIARTGLATRKAITIDAPVFEDAYLVYEMRLASPTKDFYGHPIYTTPWINVGSHRVYFLEIKTIQLRQDIAAGQSQIYWRSLPVWQSIEPSPPMIIPEMPASLADRYIKKYNPHYFFPSDGTVAFEADSFQNDMAIKHLPPLPEDQIEVDNDRARWPSFFPSSTCMITTKTQAGIPNAMPCGSTTIISRHPLVIAVCVAYANINQRYAPRATLDIIRESGRFGCGVPFIDERVIQAINYTGNISLKDDPKKVFHAGLAIAASETEAPADWSPVFPDLPIHFECHVTGEIRLGTHIMFLGEVQRIRVRADVTTNNPQEWCPWADVVLVNKH